MCVFCHHSNRGAYAGRNTVRFPEMQLLRDSWEKWCSTSLRVCFWTHIENLWPSPFNPKANKSDREQTLPHFSTHRALRTENEMKVTAVAKALPDHLHNNSQLPLDSTDEFQQTAVNWDNAASLVQQRPSNHCWLIVFLCACHWTAHRRDHQTVSVISSDFQTLRISLLNPYWKNDMVRQSLLVAFLLLLKCYFCVCLAKCLLSLVC